MSELILVAGARPNFMKAAPILRALDARRESTSSTLVHTGQHYDAAMSDVFLEQLGIRKPDVMLGVGSGSHGAQTAGVMVAFEKHILSRGEPPCGVVVVGDVNSTLACALVATKLHIPVAHVEAGLRSFDRHMPEEINRLVTDSIADVLLVSEPAGLENLEREGIPDERIHYVGNVMIDTLVHQLSYARELEPPYVASDFALVTLHRPSNVDTAERLADIVDFLVRVSERLPVVFPAHPRTASSLEKFGLGSRLGAAAGVSVLEPLGYRENLNLMERARLVITDSGGIQEETTFLGVPCMTIRPNTERPVTVTSGTNTVSDDLDVAWTTVCDVLAGKQKKGKPIDGWDGRAAERIVDVLLAEWVPG